MLKNLITVIVVVIVLALFWPKFGQKWVFGPKSRIMRSNRIEIACFRRLFVNTGMQRFYASRKF